MKNKFNILGISCLALSLILFIIGASKRKAQSQCVVEKVVTDTVIVTKTDTLVYSDIRYIRDTVVEERIIYVEDSLEVRIPIREYEFKEPGVFDMIAMGYDVSVKSINVYPKTEYRNIITTVERDRTVEKWRIYGSLGLTNYNETFIPSLGMYASSPNKIMFGISAGVSKTGLACSLTLGYRIK